MSISKLTLSLSAAAMILVPVMASAQSRAYAPGHSVRAQARANNRPPNSARELEPTAKQSATGGQSGGLPGRS